MSTIEIFHGGSEQVTSIHAGGTFGGIFASTRRAAAESHGDVVTAFELPESRVLTNYALNYEVDATDAIRALLEREAAPGADLDRVWEIVVEDAGCETSDDDVELFRAADAGEAGLEAQRIRGRVAAMLGYAAVEMRDEHGATYLVVEMPA